MHDDGPLRERLRHRLGASERQWIYLVTIAIVVPYPLAIYWYVRFTVPEPIFLGVTLVYSLIAMYVSYKF